jgi:hypothetical protein
MVAGALTGRFGDPDSVQSTLHNIKTDTNDQDGKNG